MHSETLTSDFEAELMDCERILTVDDSLNMYIDGLLSRMKETTLVSFINLVAQERSGLEMALLSLECHATRNSLPQSLLTAETSVSRENALMNGLLTRKSWTPKGQGRC